MIVEGVEPRSPAEAAGIRKGDILTQVHGTDVAGQSFFKLRMQMSEVGREFKVQVIRDNKPIDVSVTLRHYD